MNHTGYSDDSVAMSLFDEQYISICQDMKTHAHPYKRTAKVTIVEILAADQNHIMCGGGTVH